MKLKEHDMRKLALVLYGVVMPIVELLGIDKYSPGPGENPRTDVVGLLMGTGLVESGFNTAFQTAGPALGWWQMEPATHDDLILHELRGRVRLDAKIRVLAGPVSSGRHSDALAANAYYACAMARVRYLHSIEPIPSFEDAANLGLYWKAHYNTADGAGDADRFVAAYAPFLEAWKADALEPGGRAV